MGRSAPHEHRRRTPYSRLSSCDSCASSGLRRVEDLAGDPARRHRGRPAGVEREVRDDLADLFLGDTVTERSLEVPGQLIYPIERDQRGDGDQAAIALGETRPLPDVTGPSRSAR